MPAQEKRRLVVLGSILGVLLAVFIGKTVFVGDDEPGTSPAVSADPFAPKPGATTTVPKNTTTTKPTTKPTTPPSTFQVYGTKNPFEPVIQIETPTTASTRPATTTTGAGATTTTVAPSNNPGPGETVTLVDVFRDSAGTVKAHVQVGSTAYTVAEGTTFADGNYRVVSLDINGAQKCGQFLYGDSAFRLCQGQQTLK